MDYYTVILGAEGAFCDGGAVITMKKILKIILENYLKGAQMFGRGQYLASLF